MCVCVCMVVYGVHDRCVYFCFVCMCTNVCMVCVCSVCSAIN